MRDFNYVTSNEIAFHSYSDALTVAEVLLQNDYVVMISREENLYIVNYLWSPNHADRNDVVFSSREEVEDFIFNLPSDDNDEE